MSNGGRPPNVPAATVEVALGEDVLGTAIVGAPIAPYTFDLPPVLAAQAAQSDDSVWLRLRVPPWCPPKRRAARIHARSASWSLASRCDEHRARPAHPRDRRHHVAGGLVRVLATAGGTMATGDAVAMFEAARSMVDRGTLDVPAHQSSEAWRGDGRAVLHAVWHRPVAVRRAVPRRGPHGGQGDRYQDRRSRHASQGVRGRREHDSCRGRGWIRAA